jgi:hypothetical protein
MPLTATVSISGMIEVQFTASTTLASSICQNPSAAQSSRKEIRDPHASTMRIGRGPSSRSDAKLISGVHRMRVKSGAARSTAIWSASRRRQCSQTGKNGK